ncbi:MAG: hypothetical protein Q4D88_06070 [Anaerococcus sp.]|nr:hypothetical protein [Anaerococcus sp.]
MKKLEKIYPFFEFDKNGALALKVEVSELQKMYNLDDEFVTRLNKILESDIAALAGLGTAIAGPVGTTIGTIVGYLSGADFMYLVLRSAVLKKGIYIGLDWDGPFPVPRQGTW